MATISRDAVAMNDKSGTKERRILAYTGPSSYATGGDSLTPESIGLNKIEALLGLTIANSSGTQAYGWWDVTNKKILWNTATGTQVTNATDLSGYTGRFEAIGR